MDTTRRSSRANRASQPLPSASQHSSVSSISSGRADRATRSNHKTESPRKSTPSGSLSSEPPEETITALPDDTIQTRRKRGQEREKSSKMLTQTDNTNGAEEIVEDDEAVRCICGFDEYPGPPQLNEEDSKHDIREGIEESITTAADVTEDLAGFFLQCDVCKVWQHGGCVGIMNEEQSPEEYFCEECRKDLHRMYTTPNGYVIAFQCSSSLSFFQFLPSVSPDARTRRRSGLTQGWLLLARNPTRQTSLTMKSMI